MSSEEAGADGVVSSKVLHFMQISQDILKKGGGGEIYRSMET